MFSDVTVQRSLVTNYKLVSNTHTHTSCNYLIITLKSIVSTENDIENLKETAVQHALSSDDGKKTF